ncbi:MAG: hypothetical protein AAFQ73_06175 [Pseudomonadota bacterium]
MAKVRDEEYEHELHERRRGRNLAVGGVLLGLALTIFAVTIVKLGQNAANPF